MTDSEVCAICLEAIAARRTRSTFISQCCEQPLHKRCVQRVIMSAVVTSIISGSEPANPDCCLCRVKMSEDAMDIAISGMDTATVGRAVQEGLIGTMERRVQEAAEFRVFMGGDD